MQLNERCSAEKLLEELQMALGDDAELFVKLLFRMLIFHILSVTAKK